MLFLSVLFIMAYRTQTVFINPVLAIAGYMLSIVVTSNGIISQMGEIIGRGALMSAIMVLLVLPQVLTWVDKPIQKAFFGKTREEFVK